MTERMYRDNPDGDLLVEVEEGMKVYDRNGDEVGKVEFIFMGGTDEEAEQRGTGPATAPDIEMAEDDFMLDMAHLFGAGYEDMDETMRDRLLRHGFIRIDGGLLRGDSYAIRDSVTRVGEDGIHLRISKDELIEA
jgi:hypothetical protein